MGSSGFLPRNFLPFASSRLLEGEGAFSSSKENGFVSVAGPSSFPAAGVRLVPWLDSVGKAGFENFTILFFKAGATQSHAFQDDVLIGCEVHEYHRRRIVDASMTGVLPREVAQEAMIPTNSLHEV